MVGGVRGIRGVRGVHRLVGSLGVGGGDSLLLFRHESGAKVGDGDGRDSVGETELIRGTAIVVRAGEAVEQELLVAICTDSLALSDEVSGEGVDATDVVGHGFAVLFVDVRQVSVEGGDGVHVARSTISTVEYLPQCLGIARAILEYWAYLHQLDATKVGGDEGDGTIPTANVGDGRGVSSNRLLVDLTIQQPALFRYSLISGRAGGIDDEGRRMSRRSGRISRSSMTDAVEHTLCLEEGFDLCGPEGKVGFDLRKGHASG